MIYEVVEAKLAQNVPQQYMKLGGHFHALVHFTSRVYDQVCTYLTGDTDWAGLIWKR